VPRLVVEVDDGHQHQHGAGHGVEEELHRGVDAAVVAPDADQEVHGHQRDFPEHVKQEEILRHEDAHQAEFQQQQEGEEFLDAILHGAPGDQHADGREEGGEQDEPEADAVDGDVEVNLGRRIQGMSTVNCSPATPRSNQMSRPSDATKVTSAIAMPKLRLACGADRGMASAARKPASGRSRTRVRRFIAGLPG
jgi:hypothetical protein